MPSTIERQVHQQSMVGNKFNPALSLKPYIRVRV